MRLMLLVRTSGPDWLVRAGRRCGDQHTLTRRDRVGFVCGECRCDAGISDNFEDAFAPEYIELFLLDAGADPINRMSMALDRFCLTVSLSMLVAVVLSVMSGVADCGWPSLSRQVQMGQASFALWKMPASPPLAAKETTSFKI
jgi:hypothetical protein